MGEGEKEVTPEGEEGDLELEESRKERSKIAVRLPPLPPPPTARAITKCVKRPLPSASSSTPLSPLLKKTRYNPDLTLCHGCDVRFPSTNSNHCSRTRLRLLRSFWRVALLCKGCLSRIESAEFCSYCFQPVCESTVDCVACSRRVHVECARSEYRSFFSGPLDPTKFTCIDCCVFPNRSGGGSSLKCLSSVSLMAKNAKPSLLKRGRVSANDKGSVADQHKAAVSEHVVESARNPLGGTLAVKKEAPQSTDKVVVVPDEQLALQLHLAMNGSRRISRSSCSLGSRGNSVILNKGLEKVGICTEDISFFKNVDKDEFILALPVEQSANRRGRKKVTSKNNKDGRLDVSHKEDQGSCSRKLSLNSNGDGCSSTSILSSHIIGENTEVGAKSSELLENMSTVPDRYFMKYNKRNKKLCVSSNLNESELVHEDHISSSKASRRFTDIPDQVPAAEC